MPLSTPDEGLVSCPSCGATFPPETFSEGQLDLLMERHLYQDFLTEMSLLSRTQALFEKHPEARSEIESIQCRPLELLFSAGTFGDDDARLDRDEKLLGRWTDGDPELREFLRSSTFELEPRMAFVADRLQNMNALADAPAPACPRCGKSALELVEPPAE